jgi:hypothetical protein
MKFSLLYVVGFEQVVDQIMNGQNRLVYSISTCYWKLGRPIYQHPDNNLPCGPRREMLMEMNQPIRFLREAAKKSDFYGTHHLHTLMAAYHGNLVVSATGYPTSFNTWAEYDRYVGLHPSLPDLDLTILDQEPVHRADNVIDFGCTA